MRRGYLSLGIKDVFDPKGRIDRLTFFMYGMILGIVTYVMAFVGGVAIGFFIAALPEDQARYFENGYLLALLPVFYGHFCIRAKRLHDLGLPAVLALIGLVDIIGMLGFAVHQAAPFLPASLSDEKNVTNVLTCVSLVFTLLLLFIPGQRGANRYGENSTGPDRPKPKILEG
jgi:uncharacterized membrane protein YhaH (DUF805 family)